jgi:hypothetical protein
MPDVTDPVNSFPPLRRHVLRLQANNLLSPGAGAYSGGPRGLLFVRMGRSPCVSRVISNRVSNRPQSLLSIL